MPVGLTSLHLTSLDLTRRGEAGTGPGIDGEEWAAAGSLAGWSAAGRVWEGRVFMEGWVLSAMEQSMPCHP